MACYFFFFVISVEASIESSRTILFCIWL